MMTVTDIVQAIGHAAFAEAIGVLPSAVSNMKRDNRIPAKKYRIVRALCARHKLPEPDEGLFSFDASEDAA